MSMGDVENSKVGKSVFNQNYTFNNQRESDKILFANISQKDSEMASVLDSHLIGFGI